MTDLGHYKDEKWKYLEWHLALSWINAFCYYYDNNNDD